MAYGSITQRGDTFAQRLDYWYNNIIVPQIEQTTAYGHQAS